MMTLLWALFMLAGLTLCVILLVKVICYEEDPKFCPYLVPQNKTVALTPVRGDILDYKNRILATST